MKTTITFHPLQHDLFAYSGGELSPEATEEIRLHLESCAICRSEVEAWEDVRQRTADHFQSLAAPAVLPADAWNRIQAEVARPVGVRPMFGGSLLTQAATIALVGILLLWVGVGVNTMVAGSAGGGFAPIFAPPPTRTVPIPPTPQPASEKENPAAVPVRPDAQAESTPLTPPASNDAPEQGTTPALIPSPTESEPPPPVEPSPTPQPSRTPTESPEPTVEPSATLPPTPTMVPATPTAIPAAATPVVTVEPTATPSDGSVPPPWSDDPPGNADPPAPVPPPWSDDPPGNSDGNGGDGNNGNGNGGGNNGNGGGAGNGNGNGGGGTP